MIAQITFQEFHGVGEKTALNLIKEYGNIDNLYAKIDSGEANVKGKLLENLINNKELAFLSRTLGTIDVDSPIEKDLSKLEIVEWDRKKVLELFKTLRFNKFIERFNLEEEEIHTQNLENLFEMQSISSKEAEEILKNDTTIYYFFEKIDSSKNLIIKKDIKNLYLTKGNNVYILNFEENKDYIRSIFENADILKVRI